MIYFVFNWLITLVPQSYGMTVANISCFIFFIVFQILAEIDTQMRLTNLVRVLEDCISFVNQMPAAAVASSGGAVGANSMPLEEYILNTLLLKPAKWDEVWSERLHIFACLVFLFMYIQLYIWDMILTPLCNSFNHSFIHSFIHSLIHSFIHCLLCSQIKCPTVVQHVHMCHLQSLYLSLETKRDAAREGGGDTLHAVALKYRDPLPDALAATVRSALAVGEVDRGVFVPLLREFATEQLCTGE
jgi:hypothetical protein